MKCNILLHIRIKIFTYPDKLFSHCSIIYKVTANTDLLNIEPLLTERNIS